jgi:hypothetical protein
MSDKVVYKFGGYEDKRLSMVEYDVCSYLEYNELLKICKYKKILKKLKLKGEDGKLKYYEDEYKKYVNSVGYELNDNSLDKKLFDLLNN